VCLEDDKWGGEETHTHIQITGQYYYSKKKGRIE